MAKTERSRKIESWSSEGHKPEVGPFEALTLADSTTLASVVGNTTVKATHGMAWHANVRRRPLGEQGGAQKGR